MARAPRDDAGEPEWPAYRPPPEDGARPESRDTSGRELPRRSPPVEPPRTSRGPLVLVAVALVVAVGAGLVAGVAGSGSAGDDDPYDDPAPYRPLLTQDVLDDIAERLRQDEGDTEVVQVAITDSPHSDELGIRVTAAPAAQGELAAEYLYEDGAWEVTGATTPAQDDKPFDLARIDPDVVEDVVLRVRDDATSDGDGITSTYVSVTTPLAEWAGWIWVSLDETDDETWIARAELDGRVLISEPFD